MKRYHPFLVGLHWLIAVMILVALILGGPSLAEIPNDSPDKMFGLTGHMIWGLTIGALMVTRLLLRVIAKAPPHADAGSAALNSGAKLAHLGLYALVFSMVGSGIALAYSAGLFSIVFGGSDAGLPPTFSVFTARTVHGIIATVLFVLIGLHVAGWVYHQFYLRDRLISRMWFGKRS
ncbi:cytochrome b/b6 domain-containing protein [Aliiroseovarius subalbicans]|uniref:cytochrome b n=1 Tax=Aliiroseovarius subalbicans TaxID=2925840 RepID=UPI001F5AF389|nr:cytochrome b/b6 domain-containing protein [Aliiroseovarius subalbicans]MCI2399273.1 cytochrome b/b6 domain-containing protein [Aliiroseovarius subalbicans]